MDKLKDQSQASSAFERMVQEAASRRLTIEKVDGETDKYKISKGDDEAFVSEYWAKLLQDGMKDSGFMMTLKRWEDEKKVPIDLGETMRQLEAYFLDRPSSEEPDKNF